jgi:rhodanese-related sulfurtransferase
MIKQINPPQAWKILQGDKNAVLLDVRSRMEFDYVGHVPNSVFVPLKEPPAWESDADFVNKVKLALQDSRPGQKAEDITIVALCRSGARSMTAAEELSGSGFKNVMNMAEGFEGDKDDKNQRGSINGWRYHGLPWLQS